MAADGDGEDRPAPSGGPPPAEPAPGPPPADALKRASITSPFALLDYQAALPGCGSGGGDGGGDVKPAGVSGGDGGGGPPRRYQRSYGNGRSGAGADAEATSSGRSRRPSRSPWLSAPMILGTEISTNITCVRHGGRERRRAGEAREKRAGLDRAHCMRARMEDPT